MMAFNGTHTGTLNFLATFCLWGDICSKTMTVHFGRIISNILLKNYIRMST